MNIRKSALYAESWNVAWRKKPKGSLLEDTASTFHLINNSLRYWAADPFLFEYNNRLFIFAELYDYIRCRGIIGYCEIIDGKSKKWKPIIIESYHLSFPYIYQKGDEIYIMPESNSTKELYIYRAVDFPNKWQKEIVLRTEVQYADTTLLNNKGHNYALTYEVSNPDNHSLWLLDLDNENNDRLLNLSDIEIRRPAGKILQDMNIRGAQNCNGGYGKGLVFYKYSFDGNEYKEKEILRLFPENIVLSKKIFLDGMHTYNFLDNYEVIDIKTRRFNLLNLVFRTVNKLLIHLHK